MSEPIVSLSNFVIPTQQEYNASDLLLIQSTQVDTVFNPETDYIETFVYDLQGNIVNTDYDFINYATYQDSNNTIGQQYVLNSVRINPVLDLESYFFDTGAYIINYNFYKTFFSSSVNNPFYITEISSDRTEVRLQINSLSNAQLVVASEEFVNSRFGRQLDDFYLNFGDNNILIANNFLLDKSADNYSVLIKLYEPLPQRFGIKSQTWIVDKISDSASFNIEFIFEPITVEDKIYLKGPNLNLDLKDQINNSTTLQSFSSIISSSLTSSQQQYFSLLEEKGIDINIDFSDYSNFVHFSSAETRLSNFYYKVQQIENYNNELTTLNSLSYNVSVSSSKAIIQNNINSLIENFDEYEYYLYYNSSSYAWPKSNATKPYTLYSTSSTEVLNWYGSSNPNDAYYGGQILSASLYDGDNQNYIYYSIPEYIRSNPDNNQYILFMSMVGQMFDNIWIYYKDVTNKYDADNRLDFGVSRDIIAEAIRDLGIKIYQNNFSSADVFSAFLGINPDGTLLPPTGSEVITTYVTSSNGMIPLDDIEKSIYKRIYHNIPYLLKTKGTTTGLQTLISLYGIEDTILRVAEFGGKDKNESNDWDYWKSIFNYGFATNGDGIISSDWDLNTSWSSSNDVPSTLEFRFKTPGLQSGIDNPNQVLWSLESNAYITLEYNGTGYTSGSYSGSIPDPYNQYATLKFAPDWNTSPSDSASIYLPFYDGGWWSVAVTRDGNDFALYAGNNIYNGNDGSKVGFTGSALVTSNSSQWETGGSSFFPSDNRVDVNNHTAFSGSYQEIRYYNVPLSQSVFIDYVMNPQSIEGNGINSGSEQLAFRATLGGELYTGSISTHPKVTGSWEPTSSFASDSDFTITLGAFSTNTEVVYIDQPAAGIKNIVPNKIQTPALVLPSGDTLSSLISIQQNVPASSSYTPNINYTEVAFSPQNEINDDIMDSIGFFNMGEYIGDPRQRFTQAESYPDLDALRDEYFTKYKSNYDFTDYIRLIKYFDNSLFKMVQDFVPARTSLASGIVIKQNLLERNKYPQPEVTSSIYDYSGSIEMAFIEGGTGGSTPSLAYGGITQVTVLYGGTDYTGSESLYNINITGGGGEGAVLTPVIRYEYDLAQGTKLEDSIIQNTDDATDDIQDHIVTNQLGNSVTLRVTVSGGVVVSVEVRSVTASNLGFSIGDIITIPTSDIGGSYDVLIELQAGDLGGINNGFVTSVNINNPGNNYSSFPTLTIQGTSGVDAELQVTEIEGSIVTQTWTGNNITPFGLSPFTQSDASEFYNGEYSGSEFVVENGELNSTNPAKVVDTTLLSYYSTGSATVSGASNPGVGQFFWTSATYPVGGALMPDGPAGLNAIYINEIDANGVNILQALQNLNPGDSVTFTIVYDTTSA